MQWLNDCVDIRRCSQADLEALIARWPIPGQVHEHHHDEQAAGRATYLVAWEGENPLGSGVLSWKGCVGINARKLFPNAVEFSHVQVREEKRGQGVGSRLIAAAQAEASAAGVQEFCVGVGDDNPEAERLYLRLGYQATGVFDISEYDAFDEKGTSHHHEERNQLLVKLM